MLLIREIWKKINDTRAEFDKDQAVNGKLFFLTPNLRLAFLSTERPGRVGDGRAESVLFTTANGLDVQLRWHSRRR